MKILFDTSVLVAALVESHPTHKRAFPWLKQAIAKEFDMIVAAHTIAELYAVLSTFPIKPRISPLIARKLISENIETVAEIISLTSREYISVIKQISELGLAGGITYDALIAKVAQKSKVERLLTLDANHFTRVWPDGDKIIVMA
jgi:predicted nucleic acid-binding protein